MGKNDVKWGKLTAQACWPTRQTKQSDKLISAKIGFIQYITWLSVEIGDFFCLLNLQIGFNKGQCKSMYTFSAQRGGGGAAESGALRKWGTLIYPDPMNEFLKFWGF